MGYWGTYGQGHDALMTRKMEAITTRGKETLVITGMEACLTWAGRHL